MRRARWAVLLVVTLLAAACGGDEVEPLPRSNLPDTLPEVRAAQLLDALPEPADLGPGWTFDVDSLGDDDYFQVYSSTSLAEHCPNGSPDIPWLATAESPHTISGFYDPPNANFSVAVEIAVDTPARSADRMSVLRRAFTRCGEIEYERIRPVPDEDNSVTRTTESQPITVPGADEALLAHWAAERADVRETGKLAYARSGGLVVAIDGTDLVAPILPAVLAEAKQALGL